MPNPGSCPSSRRYFRYPSIPHLHIIISFHPRSISTNQLRQADELVRNDPALNHEYLPIKGLADYTTAAQKLMIGADSPAIRENRVSLPPIPSAILSI